MTVGVGPVVSDAELSDAEVVGELRAAWAQVSRGYARCWAAMAQVAGRSPTGWESAEIAAALTFTTRRADYELGCAVGVIERLPQVFAALACGQLDHHKARVFADYLADVTAAQAEVICARLVPAAAGWTTGQLAARLLREVTAIDPDYTRRSYQDAVRERGSTATSITPAPPCSPAPGCPPPTPLPPPHAWRHWPTRSARPGIRPPSARPAPMYTYGYSTYPRRADPRPDRDHHADPGPAVARQARRARGAGVRSAWAPNAGCVDRRAGAGAAGPVRSRPAPRAWGGQASGAVRHRGAHRAVDAAGPR